MAEAPMQSDGTIFLLQQRRRNVSEERSFLWNFQPIREEYSQPSPSSRRYERDKDEKRMRKYTHSISQIYSFFLIKQILTSATAALSDIFLLGLMSLFLRWTWYIFSAATQDLGLSSGGMVTPYSQPNAKRHTDLVGPAVLQT